VSKRTNHRKTGEATDGQKDRHPANRHPPISKRRRRVFIAITILLPFVLIAAAEGILRLCGIGGHISAIKVVGEFRGSELATTYVPGGASYFDLTKSTPGSIGEYTFLVPKPANTFRVVLSGASAVKGYPQPMGLANSAFLKEMLGDVWPDRSVEVINLGTTAVATFPVLDMLTQMLEYEPDLVIVYAGHNEFFGTYGVGSMQSAGDTPTAIRFFRWRSGLGLVNLFSRLTAPTKDSSGKALMEKMVGQANIAFDSPLRESAANNAGFHVGQMIDRCRTANVPVMVCTLPSNEKDLSPVGTVDVSHLSDADQSRLKKLIESGAANVVTDSAAAIAELKDALRIHPQHARAHYLLGKALLASGDRVSAATHFHKAIDCDPMPWRATSATIDAIVSATISRGAPVCEVRQAFRKASADGIIGAELMDDHVHFSLRGQELLARTIVQALTDFDGLCAVDAEVFDALPDWKAYANRLGANEYERYAVAHGLRSIFDVPFMRSSNPETYERWDHLCKRLISKWPIAIQRVAQEWQDPKMHRTVRRPLSAFVARAFIREKKFALAKPLMEFSSHCVPLFSTWNIEYVYSTLLCDERLHGGLDEAGRTRAADTIERIQFMLKHGAGNAGLIQRFSGRLHQLRGEWAESIPLLEQARKHLWEIEKVACDAALIEAYVRTGDKPKAKALAQEGASNAGRFAKHYIKFQKAIPQD